MRNILTMAGLFLLLFSVGCGDSQPIIETKPSADGKPAEMPTTVSPATSDQTPAKPDKPVVSPSPGRIETPADPPVDKSTLGKSVAQLADANEAVRVQAEQSLIDAGAGAIPSLLAGIKDKSPEVRRAVAYFLLDSFPSTDGRIAAAYRDALGDDDRKVRQLALQAVKRMSPEAMALAVPKIAGLLDSSREEPINRADAARLLGKLQAEARDALPALIKTAASDPSEKVRAPALFSITKIAEPAQVLPVLVKSLANDKDASVRLVAATGLGRLGPAAGSAVADLAAALEDRDDKVRRAASDALSGLEDAAVLPQVVAKLDSTNPRTREVSLYTLGRLGPLARPALPAIEKLTKDQDAAVRTLAESVAVALRGT